MTFEDATDFAHDWIAAWNAHDLDQIVGHYAQEIEFVSPLIVERLGDASGTIHNRDALREYFGIGLNNNPALRFAFKQVLMGVRGFTLIYENARGGVRRQSILNTTQKAKSRAPSVVTLEPFASVSSRITKQGF